MSNITQNKTIINPIEIPLPKEIRNCSDPIVDVQCGKRHSFIVTESGKLWAVGNLKFEKAHRLQ